MRDSLVSSCDIVSVQDGVKGSQSEKVSGVSRESLVTVELILEKKTPHAGLEPATLSLEG